MLPHAREEQLVVQALDGETLVYDLRDHRALCLNRTTALVWRCCDGRTPLDIIAARLHADLDVPADERLVRLALDRLEKAGLLRERLERREGARLSRREVGQKLGLVG